jgi:hypothetical protein
MAVVNNILEEFHVSILTFTWQDFRLFCGMVDGLAFLPVPDLTNGIHLLRTLCPDDPPEAVELLDYFDSTYIIGRLRQHNPAQNQAVSLLLSTNVDD